MLTALGHIIYIVIYTVWFIWFFMAVSHCWTKSYLQTELFWQNYLKWV